MKRIMVFMLIACLVVISGCQKGKVENKSMDLRYEDYPFKPGDVVSLKPNNIAAVISGIERQQGTYQIKYTSNNTSEYDILNLVKVDSLVYYVRCKDNIFPVNWYEINGKWPDTRPAQAEAPPK